MVISNFEWDFFLPRITIPGVTNISDSSNNIGQWWAIQILADSQFLTLTEMGATGSLTGVIKAGSWLLGRFTEFQLSSGMVRAYKY